MKFYCLHEGFYEGVQLRLDQLQTACKELNVQFIALNSLEIDYSNLPQLTKADLLYNATRGSETLESLLLNKEVTTFYINNPNIIELNTDTTKYSIIHQKAGIPSPKTVFNARNNKDLLKCYIDFVGGFPAVLKIKGGTLGVGTLIVKDLEGLFSISDYLISTNAEYIIRQYIKPKEVARLIVVGDCVVASNKKFIAIDDFRTSVKQKPPLHKEYSKEVQQIAVKASNLANFENVGVDIIFDENDNPYLLEINMPHDFVTTAKVTGINIAYLMIEYLIKKASQ